MDALVGAHLLAVPLPFDAPSTATDKALVVVESRPSFFLPHVVASFVKHHPDWRLYVFGTPAVHALLGSRCNNYANVRQVELATQRLTIEGYNRMLMSEEFWGLIREEHVLVFQADCVCVRGTPSRFLRYDYVGPVCGTLHPDQFVMNGGLSLRRRSAMLRAVRSLTPDARRKPEDVAFTETMRASGDFVLPGMEECNEFAIESIGNPDTAIGMHGTDKYYAPPTLVAQLFSGRTA